MNPTFDDYPLELRPLTTDEGGGWLATFPDLPGCMADGETPEAAIADAREAFACLMAVHREEGRPDSPPGGGGESGRFVLRTPKSLHGRLAARAVQEGVSMNTLLVALLSEAVGMRPQAGKRLGRKAHAG